MKKQTSPNSTDIVEIAQEPINNYHQFDAAVLDIHRNIEQYDDPYLEVTPEFFQALSKGTKTTYMTYGKPGIKVYIKGTKEGIDNEEKMSADEWRTRKILEKSGSV